MAVLLWLTIVCYGLGLAGYWWGSRIASERLVSWSGYLGLTGFLALSLLLVQRMLEAGHAPMMGRYETLVFYAWVIGGLNLFLQFRYEFRSAERFTSLVILFALGLALVSDAAVTPVPPILQTRWFEFHVVTSFMAYALFTLAAATGALWLLKRDHTASLLQEITYRSMLWGFALFSLSMLLGAIWGYLAWGAYWQWEAKSTASMLLWFYYAGVLHTRYVKAWRGMPMASLATLGFALTLFTYLGVSVFLDSTHRM